MGKKSVNKKNNKFQAVYGLQKGRAFGIFSLHFVEISV